MSGTSMQVINDHGFKADFLINLMENRKKVTNTEVDMAWLGAVDAMKQVEYDCQVRNLACDLTSLKHAVMRSAELGLSLHRNAKECYVGIDGAGQGGSFKLGFCYRGLRRLMLRNPEVKRFSSQVVHDVDKFEWRGECERPNIIINGNSSNVIFAYGWMELRNGDINSVLLNTDELLSIERMDVERAIQFYGNENQSLYRTHWRKRMFEIEALKALFRHCGDIIEITSSEGSDVFGLLSAIGGMD